jgi:hypothetical protein
MRSEVGALIRLGRQRLGREVPLDGEHGVPGASAGKCTVSALAQNIYFGPVTR